VRIALHRIGYVCKRPRWVLSRKAQAQPGWAKNGSSAASVGPITRVRAAADTTRRGPAWPGRSAPGGT
jgi:hypothetical protein